LCAKRVCCNPEVEACVSDRIATADCEDAAGTVSDFYREVLSGRQCGLKRYSASPDAAWKLRFICAGSPAIRRLELLLIDSPTRRLQDHERVDGYDLPVVS